MDGVNTSLPQMEVQAGDLGKDLGLWTSTFGGPPPCNGGIMGK